jgi:hypothetical protein
MMESWDTEVDREGQANQPVEATETPHTVSRMGTATCPGASGLRASPRWPREDELDSSVLPRGAAGRWRKLGAGCAGRNRTLLGIRV